MTCTQETICYDPNTMFYKFALTNVARYLKGLSDWDRDNPEVLDAFQISQVLAIVFCKKKEEILADILVTQKEVG